MRKSSPDVLVVGAGPVGLTLAAELARHGVFCRIIDKLAEPLIFCRAIGVTPRSLEVWEDMGVVQPMINAGLWLTGSRDILGQTPARDAHYESLGLPYAALGIPQPETERILTEHLATFGIAVERPVTLNTFQQDSDGVHVELLRADGSTERATFQYIAGCDGAHSAVRRGLEIPFEGEHFPFEFMLGDVLLDYDLPRGMALRVVRPAEKGPPDFFVAIPLPEKNRYRVSMVSPNAALSSAPAHGLQSERPGPSIDELQVVADRLLPGQIRMSDVRWSSLFRIGMRLAARYRQGRCFIAGDAAHIHPPTGGQGMNTGIQDAYNLAWKMGLVLSGAAPSALLDTYEAERRPVGADVVQRTQRQSEQFGRTPQQERLTDSQVLVNYRTSKLSKDVVTDGTDSLPVRAGDRAPDCSGLVRENVLYPYRLFDITRGTGYVLLLYVADFNGPEQRELAEALVSALKESPGIKSRLVLICPPGAKPRDVIGATILKDTAGEFAAAYAPGIGTGYTIRPDGYVGYHGRPATVQGFLDYLRV